VLSFPVAPHTPRTSRLAAKLLVESDLTAGRRTSDCTLTARPTQGLLPTARAWSDSWTCSTASGWHVEVLLLLRVAASGATVAELAAALDREVITIRRTAGDLVGRGLVRQRAAPRGRVLEVMPTGLRVLDRLAQPLDLSQQSDA
jgi:hypothetical protein